MAMDASGTTSLLIVAALTILCGIGDAQGFIHAGKVWQGGRFDWAHALKSAAGFQFGVVTYWIVLRQLAKLGVAAVEVQTLFWFVATIIGVALLSGQVVRWPLIDQAVACCVLAGVGWLMYRTAH
ncbi:MAG TPA: hypothetical protein VNM70_17475 [Burkholderiales bacterium]|nr:hypothetical protein [Burkholderiales bacterium]